MEMFDLVDIQRVRHPNLRKFTYQSKPLNMKSRLDFFLVDKNLTRSVKKTEIYSAIAPVHDAIYILLSWTGKTFKGPGLWKFNNTLLSDERYVAIVRDQYSQARSYYSYLTDKRLFWEMMKMEIRTVTTSYAKSKAKSTSDRELEIRRHLERLDNTICNNFSAPNIDDILKEYDCLKSELQSIYEDKGRQAMFRAKWQWVEYGERPTKFLFNMEKRNYKNSEKERAIKLES